VDIINGNDYKMIDQLLLESALQEQQLTW